MIDGIESIDQESSIEQRRESMDQESNKEENDRIDERRIDGIE